MFVSVGNTVYGLNPDRSAVYKYNGTPESWSQIGGPAVSLINGGSNLYAISPSDFSIWQYMGTGDQWQRIGGPGFMFVSVGNTVYGLNPDRSAVYQFVSLDRAVQGGSGDLEALTNLYNQAGE
jgi:hypothetical protein